MDAQKSMREHPAFEIRTDLSLDEPGDGCTLPSRPSQERFDLPSNDFVEQGLFGFVAFVSDGGKQSIGTIGAGAFSDIASDMPQYGQ